MDNFIKCPLCVGKGKIEIPVTVDKKKRAVICLRKNGFGIREIQRLFNYKSPHSISNILNNK